MDFTDFQNTLVSNQAHTEWSEALKAMWYDAKGDWKASHNIAQDMHNILGSWSMPTYIERRAMIGMPSIGIDKLASLFLR